IASVTRPFCGNCDRMRLTADGQLRNCLFARDETDLRAILRDPGLTDDEIRAGIRARLHSSVAAKLPGHGIDDPAFIQPPRPMSAIGG
ncbi:MAG: GTP 3',8-cyclase MoaA, partial [Actinomycetota bacterium]